MSAGQLSVGNLATLRFPRLLAKFWEQGFTGAFRARSEMRPGSAVTKEVLLERGWLAWAASDDPGESIRNYLLHRGLLRPEQWRLAEEKAGPGQIRQTLLDLGFLTPREMQDADRERVTGIVLSLFAWRNGEYEIGPGPLSHGTPHLKIDPRDLVLEGLLSSGDRESVLEEIGSLDAVLVVRPDDLVRASLSLPVELVGLMGKADGTRTVAEICALSSQADFLISAALAALKALGLARPLEGGPAAAPPEPPKSAPSGRRSRRRDAWTVGMEPFPQTPMLPLEEPPAAGEGAVGAGPATIPVRTPPAGLPAVGAGEGPSGLAAPEAPDPGTVPLRGLGVREPSVAPRSTEIAPGLTAPAEPPAEDDSGTVPVRTPPFGLPAMQPDEEGIAAASAGSEPAPAEAVPGSEGPEDETEREGETELSPGIPVDLRPGEPENVPEEDLDGVEIEDAIQRLGDGDEDDSQGHETPLEEATPRAATAGEEMPGEEDRVVEETEFEDGGGPESYEDAGLEDRRDPEEEPFGPEGAGEAAGEEHPRGWIYQPSGEAAAGTATSARWPIWTAVTLTALVIGIGLTFLFRTAGARAGDAPDSAQIEGSGRALPPVEVPRSDSDTESSGETLSAAALAEPAPPGTPAAQPPREAAASPASEKPDSAPDAGIEGAGLAPPERGGMFQSSAYRQGRDLLLRGRYQEAAREFASAAASGGDGYTIQLALACEAKTVERALGTASGSSELYILPKRYNGRDCYRLVWGAYPDRAAALRSWDSVPRGFISDRSKPFPSPL